MLHAILTPCQLVLGEHLIFAAEREHLRLPVIHIDLLICMLLVELHFPQAQALFQTHFFERARVDGFSLRFVTLHKSGLVRQKHQIGSELTIRLAYVGEHLLGLKFVNDPLLLLFQH